MRTIFFIVAILFAMGTKAQELYVYTEPASNMPAKSISTKLTGMFVPKDNMYGRVAQRYRPEIMFGFSKKLMMHLSGTFANMHTNKFGFESVALYGKYRFLSKDDFHSHFRMAAFADASYSRVPFHYDEISLGGDKSGVEAGVIATQLWHKFALSGTISHTQVLDKSRSSKVQYIPERNYQSLNYSLSGGYLLLPREYNSYKQLNVNLYTEFLAQQTLDRKTHFIDMAPAVQFIFNSNAKLNLGYRFQVAGNMNRMAKQSFLIAFERTFLNALK